MFRDVDVNVDNSIQDPIPPFGMNLSSDAIQHNEKKS